METFKKEERLYNKKVIELLFREGTKFYINPYKVVWMRYDHNWEFPAKILISVSKHSIKKAVVRNRIKRQIREIYRRNKREFYNVLDKKHEKCIFSIIYAAKDVLSYAEQEKKIILILQRLQKEYEKVVE